MQLCDSAGLSFQAVLTKIDKVPAAERAAAAERVAAELARHPAAHPEIHLTSAEKGVGLAALRAMLAGFAMPDDPDIPRRHSAARAVAQSGAAR
jgi:GTP-binding protein